MTRMTERLLGMVLLSLVLLLTGCTTAAAPDEEPAWPVRLRLVNTSQVNLEDVVVIFPGERLLYGTLAAGATSDYQPAWQGVYRYAALQLTVDGERRSIPVIDWVGERPLGPGAYSLVLTLNLQHPEPWQQVQHEIRRDP